MFRNKTATQKNFAIVPKAEIPRSKFRMNQTRKQPFDASDLIPIMVEEVLPGDVWQHKESIAARLATPIAPVVDDLALETFYFYVPNRIAWPFYWQDFITGKNVNVVIPTMEPTEDMGTAPVPVGSVWDHMGIPPGIYTNINFAVNAIPTFGYFMIWNEWFRDQNLQDPWVINPEWTTGSWLDITTDEGATAWDGMPLRINKRHDYFTSSLPWPQKGDAVTIPLGTTAPIISNGLPPTFEAAGTTWPGPNIRSAMSVINAQDTPEWTLGAPGNAGTAQMIFSNESGLEVDLQDAAAAQINTLRLMFQIQKLLERDARGGSRYVEQLLSHFGVRSPDYRLQRPEYLGGSKIPITVNPIAQTAAYDAEPSATDSALGNLGAEMHASSTKRTFTYAATEHGYIIGLAAARATPTYQQGIRRHFRRRLRYDFYFPVFSHLGEQGVDTREIYQPLDDTPANIYWGYQERWAELRYTPNEITGHLRSQTATPMDWWHYAEEFENEPALNAEFITDKTKETLARSLATAPNAQWATQIIMDINHESIVARLMPTYSEPGLIDHF